VRYINADNEAEHFEGKISAKNR